MTNLTKSMVKLFDFKNISKSNVDSITRLVVESIEEQGLSFDNCIQIMSDNVSANRGCHIGAVIQIKNKYANHLIDIGGCSLHHVTNACQHALKVQTTFKKTYFKKIINLLQNMLKNPLNSKISVTNKDIEFLFFFVLKVQITFKKTYFKKIINLLQCPKKLVKLKLEDFFSG